MKYVSTCTKVPIITFCYRIPLLFRAVKGYISKTAATIERIITDRSNAVGYGYTRKTAAILERRIADRCNAVGYGYTRKTDATLERIRADRCNTVGNYKFGYKFII